MENIVNQKDIVNGWQKIADEAIKKATECKSDFRADAVYVGGMTVIGGSLITALNGGTLSSIFLAVCSIGAIGYSHVKHASKKELFVAFNEHALDKRDIAIKGESDLTKGLPRFNKEKSSFLETYKSKNILSALLHFRMGVATAMVGTAIVAYELPKEEPKQPSSRPEETEPNATQGSLLELKLSLCPRPHP